MRKSAFVAAIVAAWLLPGAAQAQSPSPDPAVHPIRPGQFFAGLVNDKARDATIAMACPPISTSRFGHPVAGQHVSVRQLFPPSLDTGLGFTGRASTISAILRLVSTSTANAIGPIPLAVFSLYDAPVTIPATLTLPCNGAGAVTFDPVQGGNTAQSFTTRVRFVSITTSSD